MLHDPARHEALQPLPWSERRALDTITRIVGDTERHFSAAVGGWPAHPRDVEPGEDPQATVPGLYYGTCGTLWALHYLQDVGAVQLARDYRGHLPALDLQCQAWLAASQLAEPAAYLMGRTPILMLAYGQEPSPALADELAALIAGNLENPARELMWGSPGTLLAALFLHERSGDPRWAELFRRSAAQLWSELQWSEQHGCHYWIQDLYGRRSSYLDAVHGFVATASPLIRGRHLLGDGDWAGWQRCIVQTVTRTAHWEGGMANWRTQLDEPAGGAVKVLTQFCHGAPGFVICLAELPDPALDELLLAAGETTWVAGPLAKGSNLCHGTGGNGYAFLKLYRRSGDTVWLERARAFAMHAILQSEADAAQYGRTRPTLWTGDPGLAVYLWDCVRGEAAFPTLDVFYA